MLSSMAGDRFNLTRVNLNRSASGLVGRVTSRLRLEFIMLVILTYLSNGSMHHNFS